MLCPIRFARNAALLLSAILGTQAQAFQPLITDDTGTQGTGGKQIELGISSERTSGTQDRTDTLPATFTYGISETIDLFAGIGYTRITSSNTLHGFGNPTVGFKWRLLDLEASKTSVAIKPEISLPISSRRETAGFGSAKISGKLTMIVSQELDFGAVHANIGAGRDRYRDTSANPDTTTLSASLAPVWDMNAQWKLALDVGAESARSKGERVVSRYLGMGIVYAPNKDTDLALGAFRTTSNESGAAIAREITAGITYRF